MPAGNMGSYRPSGSAISRRINSMRNIPGGRNPAPFKPPSGQVQVVNNQPYTRPSRSSNQPYKRPAQPYKHHAQ